MSITIRVEPVTFVRWPQEELRRQELAREGRPRLLLVDLDVDPPVLADPLEDWVRSPADPTEVVARSNNLAWRAGGVDSEDVPVLDEGDLLRYHGAWTALSPAEARTVRRLIDHFDQCVPRDALDTVSDAALNTHIKRVRRRVEPLGLVINTVRGRGFVLSDHRFLTPGTSDRSAAAVGTDRVGARA